MTTDAFRFRNCRIFCPDDEFVVRKVRDQQKRGPLVMNAVLKKDLGT